MRKRLSSVGLSRWITVAGTTGIGASDPLPSVPATVGLPNQLPSFDLGGANWSKCPVPAIALLPGPGQLHVGICFGRLLSIRLRRHLRSPSTMDSACRRSRRLPGPCAQNRTPSPPCESIVCVSALGALDGQQSFAFGTGSGAHCTLLHASAVPEPASHDPSRYSDDRAWYHPAHPQTRAQAKWLNEARQYATGRARTLASVEYENYLFIIERIVTWPSIKRRDGDQLVEVEFTKETAMTLLRDPRKRWLFAQRLEFLTAPGSFLVSSRASAA